MRHVSYRTHDLLIDRRVTGIRNHTLRVIRLAVRAPHLSRVANDRGHGGVDDDVAGHMQVGDPLVGVHHRHGRPLLVHSLNVGFDGFALILRQGLDLRVEVTDPVVRIHAQLLERLAMLLEHVLVIDRHGMTEDLGIRDLHHGGFHMNREQDALLLGVFDLLLQELAQGPLAHERGIDDFIGLQRHFRLEHGRLAVLTDKLDPRIGRCGQWSWTFRWTGNPHPSYG